MGYTHYWYRGFRISPKTYTAIVQDFRKMVPRLEAFGIKLGDGCGRGQPILTDRDVCFNGLEKCGHPQNSNISIPWPSANPRKGVLSSNQELAVTGHWFAGVVLDQRTCDGDCSYETFSFPRQLSAKHSMKKELREFREYDKDNVLVVWRTNPAVLGKYFECCKTAFRPYDLAVQTFLVIAKHHLGDRLHVASDGDFKHWIEAVSIVDRTLGYGYDFKLTKISLKTVGGVPSSALEQSI